MGYGKVVYSGERGGMCWKSTDDSVGGYKDFSIDVHHVKFPVKETLNMSVKHSARGDSIVRDINFAVGGESVLAEAAAGGPGGAHPATELTFILERTKDEATFYLKGISYSSPGSEPVTSELPDDKSFKATELVSLCASFLSRGSMLKIGKHYTCGDGSYYVRLMTQVVKSLRDYSSKIEAGVGVKIPDEIVRSIVSPALESVMDKMAADLKLIDDRIARCKQDKAEIAQVRDDFEEIPSLSSAKEGSSLSAEDDRIDGYLAELTDARKTLVNQMKAFEEGGDHALSHGVTSSR